MNENPIVLKQLEEILLDIFPKIS